MLLSFVRLLNSPLLLMLLLPLLQRLILTGKEWSGLVQRLNESSKRKQAYLMRAQHQQIASELTGERQHCVRSVAGRASLSDVAPARHAQPHHDDKSRCRRLCCSPSRVAGVAGLTFAPSISDRSRELAAHNKTLPERMEALAHRKKLKMEKIRHDRV